MKNCIKDLIEISTYAGATADYTQGGGGNTSVKNNENGIMLIKASGYKLKDITENTAFVAVDNNAIKNYYNNVDLSIQKDYEKESAELSKNSIVELEGVKTLRPSVEVGFHSILKKYVIHTHSVYANILTCSKEGVENAGKIFKDKGFDFIFLPYINPGFELTLAMKKGIEDHIKNYKVYPEVIFMQNHGLVVNSDDINRVKQVNEIVNQSIIEYFNLPKDFKSVCLEEVENGFVSKTQIIKDFLKDNTLNLELLDKYPLYPDQLVYLNNVLKHNKDLINIEKTTVKYNTDIKQATTLEETLSAYLYVLDNILKNGLTISVMNEKEVSFINNWEAEKYRSSIK